MNWGLALGGGGPVGLAWEVGVLAALAEGDMPGPEMAAMIVGTSAGSMLGAWLRQGRSLVDLEAGILAGTRLPGRALPLTTDDERRVYAEALRLWARPATMTTAQARSVGEVSARVTRPDPERLDSFEAEFGVAWPEGGLIVTSCRIDSGERVGWTHLSGQPLHLTVAASCTVPGQSPPLEIAGAPHVDGGVWSSTNADLLAGCGVDGGLVLSPMAGAMGLGRAQAARLEAECETLGALGVETLSVDPGDAFKSGKIDLLDARSAPIALELGRECGGQLRDRFSALVGVTNSA